MRTIFLVRGLSGVEVNITRDTGTQCSYEGNRATSRIWVYHRNWFAGLLPAAETPFCYRSQVNGHLVKVDDFAFVSDPLCELDGKLTTFLIKASLVHAFPWHLLSLGEGDSSSGVDIT